MAYDIVNEENVYTCTGNPLPSDIATMVEWMLNEDFTTAYQSACTPYITGAVCHPGCGVSSQYVEGPVVCGPYIKA